MLVSPTSRVGTRTGLAGPLWGLFAAIVAAIIGKVVGAPVALAETSVGATINLFNVTPVWQLDGARWCP